MPLREKTGFEGWGSAGQKSGATRVVSLGHEQAARRLGRLVALCIILIGALSIGIAFSACADDDDDYGSDGMWYIAGVWQNNSYPDEDMVFNSDGTGYWESLSEGSYLDFDYYCQGDWIYFTMYPVNGPSYTLDCTIDMVSGGSMSITWPAGSMYGPVTIWYSRVN